MLTFCHFKVTRSMKPRENMSGHFINRQINISSNFVVILTFPFTITRIISVLKYSKQKSS